MLLEMILFTDMRDDNDALICAPALSAPACWDSALSEKSMRKNRVETLLSYLLTVVISRAWYKSVKRCSDGSCPPQQEKYGFIV